MLLLRGRALIKLRKEPDSGLLITLFQFVFTCLSTLHYQFDPRGRYFLRSSPVPFRKWCISAALFFTVNMLNNWAFAFNISVPVHIILRSFGSREELHSLAGVLCRDSDLWRHGLCVGRRTIEGDTKHHFIDHGC
jgi:hypothetical protein